MRGRVAATSPCATMWKTYATRRLSVCLLSTPMLLSSVSGVLFGVLGAGGDPELLRLCWLYNLWTPLMLPFIGYIYIANTTARAQGDTLTPFKAIALANTVNIDETYELGMVGQDSCRDPVELEAVRQGDVRAALPDLRFDLPRGRRGRQGPRLLPD